MKWLSICVFLLSFSVPFAAADIRRQTFQHSSVLQEKLESAIEALKETDPNLAGAKLRIAVVDFSRNAQPAYAHLEGNAPVYPASVVKLVYLIAAYRWKELGRLKITESVLKELKQMIGPSSNKATQKVFYRLTQTNPGPALSGETYSEFKKRRLSVKTWLQSLGITDLHTVHPTYDGGGDIFGRDAQFLQDTSVEGGLQRRDGTPANRQSMTALYTAKLLVMLANGELLNPVHTQEVIQLMRRDIARQPYQTGRIAGGAARLGKEFSTYSKTGTWGPIFADAGIVQNQNGRGAVIVVFIDRDPPYRGSFIADLTEVILRDLLFPDSVQSDCVDHYDLCVDQ